MIEMLVAHKRELETELRKCVQNVLKVHEKYPDSISIEAKLMESKGDNRSRTIRIWLSRKK